MDTYDYVKMFHNLNLFRSNPGSIFVHEMQDMSYEEQADIFIRYVQGISNFDIEDKWFLPFDVVTYLRTAKIVNDPLTHYRIDSVTIRNNKQNRIDSEFNYVFVTPMGVFIGSFKLISVKDKTPSEISELKQSYLKGDDKLTLFAIPSAEDANFIVMVRIDQLSGKKHKTKKIITKRFTKKDYDNESYKPFYEHIQRIIIYCIGYFTEKIVNASMVVVEERIAKRVNGVVKESKRHDPVFKIMPMKDIRCQYIQHNHGDRKLEWGHPRCRHERTFRSERFKNCKGNTIVIDPCWVGPVDSYDPAKERLYKVILDKHHKSTKE